MKFTSLTVLMLLVFGPVMAADTGYSSTQGSQNSDYRTAAQYVDAGRYADAIPLLMKVAKAEPENADAFSLLGYSYRKSGDLDRSGVAYRQALSLKPRHLNALEYQGELFLMLGQVDKAEANLQRISKQCLFVCEQERLLKAAIAEWRKNNGS